MDDIDGESYKLEHFFNQLSYKDGTLVTPIEQISWKQENQNHQIFKYVF